MIAVKIGTTQWHAADVLAPDEVEFAGEFLYEANGFTPAMVWDAGLNNIRPRTAAETLTRGKAARIAQINAECRSRLLTRFGDPAEQVSRSIGVYGATEKAALESGISATIDASNVASDLVTAATTVQEVEAVTVTWPVI